MAGRNRYTPRGSAALLEKADKKATGTCVFVSHQFADLAFAIQVANELKALDIDIWLDAEDVASKEAVASNDQRKLAEAVEWGLTNCTHLLALISLNTKGSWWVPFEVGSARGRSKPLAFLVHKDVSNLPAWITLGERLLDQIDFEGWVNKISTSVLTESVIKRRKHGGIRLLANILPPVRTS